MPFELMQQQTSR